MTHLVKQISPEAAAEFLYEMARYWDRQPDNGEDMAHWAHVFNAENCRAIADLVRRQKNEARTPAV